MKKIIKLGLSIMFILSIFGSKIAFAEDTTPNLSETPPAYGRKMTETERKESVQKAKEEKEKADKEKKNTEKVEANTPASVTGEKFQGTGTVTDFSTSGSKAFYTIKDKDQNVFYLIIDMDKTDNNVYFLSDISKANMETQGQTNNSQVNNQQSTNQSETTPVKPTQEKKSSSNSFLWIVLLVAVGGLTAYYFLVFKKKPSKATHSEESTEAGEIPEGDMYNDIDIIGSNHEVDEE